MTEVAKYHDGAVVSIVKENDSLGFATNYPVTSKGRPSVIMIMTTFGEGTRISRIVRAN